MSYKKLRFTKTKIAAACFVLALGLQGLVPFLSPSASAGNLANTLVRVDRLAQSQSTSGMVCAKPTNTAATYAHVVVTFPGNGTQGSNSFGVNSTAANWTTTTTNLPSGASAWPGIGTATTVSGASVTFPSGNLTSATTLYCFNFAGASTLSTPTNNGSNLTGTVVTQTNVPATIDSGNWAVTIVGANLDQVTVSATVNPTFSMSVSPNSDSLGTLSASAVSTGSTPPVATVSTNAANGWYLWGKDANAGLTSINASKTIASDCSAGNGANSTLGTNAEGYNLGAVVTSGSETIAANFVGGSTGKGGGLCTTYQTIASATAPANAAQVTMTNYASISNTTPPATDYADTETFVGAGLF